jgi:hypothetical protein
MHMCALVYARMYAAVREKIGMYLLLGTWDLRGHRHTRIGECVLLLQRDDGKKHTGVYPLLESCALTVGGPENQPGVSSLCSRRYESANEQEPQTVLAGGRALTAARSPFLAAS